MRSRRGIVAASFVLVMLVLSASAAAVPVYYAADETIVRYVLDEMELEYEYLLDEDGDPIWTFTHLGILVTIIPYDEGAPGRYASLLFYTGWATEGSISLTLINDWNRSARFGRAYVDDLGDPVIELDLLMVGGVTTDTLREYITVFVQAASSLGVALQL